MRAPHIGCAAGAALLAALAAGLIEASCAETRGLLTDIPSPPAEIQQACSLATTRCSHCHPIERVVVSRGIGASKWEMYVEQMRLKPSSGISRGDAEIIFRCLRFVEQACVECKRGPS